MAVCHSGCTRVTGAVIDHFGSPFPSLTPAEVGPLETVPLNPPTSGERCKLPQWSLGRSPSCQRFRCILRTYWWHLRCALFYAHDLSFHAHPCLKRAYNIFIYFVSPKKLPHVVSVPTTAGARGHMPLPPYPPLLVCHTSPQYNEHTVMKHDET